MFSRGLEVVLHFCLETQGVVEGENSAPFRIRSGLARALNEVRRSQHGFGFCFSLHHGGSAERHEMEKTQHGASQRCSGLQMDQICEI